MRDPTTLAGFAAIAARLGTQTYLAPPPWREEDAPVAKHSGMPPLEVEDAGAGERDQDAASETVEMFHRFEERAAIREFDGGQPRDEAERDALLELSGVLGRSQRDIIEEWRATPELSEAIQRYRTLFGVWLHGPAGGTLPR